MKNVPLNFVRYANVWEDAAVLRAGLRVVPGDRVLSIGSAGDNCLALLADDPELVVAADLNAAQLHLIALKVAVMRHLSYPEVLGFLGFDGHPLAVGTDQRLHIYPRLRSDLPTDARVFWDNHPRDIAAGVIHAGKFERYFQLFSRYIRPLIHSDATTAALLAPKSAAEQAAFYHEKWNSWRWRLLFRLFFSRQVMGNVGRDPAFLAQVQCAVSDYIFQKAEHHLTQAAATQNFILRYNLTGSFGDFLPDYLASEQQFLTIRERLSRLVLSQGYVHEAGKRHGAFHAMNLSDIFEYMPNSVFQEVGKQLHQIAQPGCRMGYWNLMVPRRLSLDLPDLFRYEEEISQRLTAADRGFFYNQFVVDLSGE